MSILIKGMEMPKKRETITITICDDGIVFEEWKEPGSVFKAIPVQPHGRLIDANKLCELCDIMADKCDGVGEAIWNQFRTIVEWSTTIIPEEEGET